MRVYVRLRAHVWLHVWLHVRRASLDSQHQHVPRMLTGTACIPHKVWQTSSSTWRTVGWGEGSRGAGVGIVGTMPFAHLFFAGGGGTQVGVVAMLVPVLVQTASNALRSSQPGYGLCQRRIHHSVIFCGLNYGLRAAGSFYVGLPIFFYILVLDCRLQLLDHDRARWAVVALAGHPQSKRGMPQCNSFSTS